ncbi:hypothetical protein D9M68_05280 [compost metagenome]
MPSAITFASLQSGRTEACRYVPRNLRQHPGEQLGIEPPDLGTLYAPYDVTSTRWSSTDLRVSGTRLRRDDGASAPLCGALVQGRSRANRIAMACCGISNGGCTNIAFCCSAIARCGNRSRSGGRGSRNHADRRVDANLRAQRHGTARRSPFEKTWIVCDGSPVIQDSRTSGAGRWRHLQLVFLGTFRTWQQVPSSGLTMRRVLVSSRRTTAAMTCSRTSPRFREMASNHFRRARRSVLKSSKAPRGNRQRTSNRCKFSAQQTRPARAAIGPMRDRCGSGVGRRKGARTPRLCSALEKGPQLVSTTGMHQLAHRLALNLTDPLAGQVELLADLFKRVVRDRIEPESHPQDLGLARR